MKSTKDKNVELLRGSKEEFLMLLNKHLSENEITDKCKRRPYFKFSYNEEFYGVSVQASEYHYCTPRLDNMEYYEEVELGFPDFLFSDAFISNYAEDEDTPKDTVYPYVPLGELAEELELLVKGVKHE